MKVLIIFLISLVIFNNVNAQSKLPLRADSVVVEKTGGNANFQVKDATRDSLGVMTNIGNGVTRFKRPRKLNDSTFTVGNDTLTIGGSGGTDLFLFPEMFGAIGDGVTNCTNSFKLMRDAVNASPTAAAIWIPVGTYLVNDSIVFTKPFKMFGSGYNSVIKTTNGTINLFVIRTTTFGHTLQDLRLLNAAVSTPTAGSGIWVTGHGTGNYNQFARYKNLYIDGFYVDVYNELGSLFTFESCIFDNPVRYGLWIKNIFNPDSGDGDIANCYFNGHTSVQAEACIRYESSGGVKGVNNKFNANSFTFKPKFSIDVNISGQTSDMLWSNNSIENFDSSAIRIRVNNNDTITNLFREIVINSNQITPWLGNLGALIDIKQVKNVSLIGNTFRKTPSGNATAIKLDSVHFATILNVYTDFASSNPTSFTNCTSIYDLHDLGTGSQWDDITGGINYPDGKVAINTTAPLPGITTTYGFDVNAGVSMFGSNANGNGLRTNSTDKAIRILTPHYTNSEEPFVLIQGGSDATDNFLTWGGGTSLGNAATYHSFYTAANNTTLTGTERFKIDNTGAQLNGIMGIGGTPTATVDLRVNKSSGTAKLWITGGTANGNYAQLLIGENTLADGDYSELIRFPNSTPGGDAGKLLVTNLNKSIQFTTAFSGSYRNDFNINPSGHLLAQSLDTDNAPPATSGTTKTLICDNTGLFSFTDNPTTIYTGNGTLLADRTVSTGGFTTTWSGSNDNETSFTVTNTGTANASALAGTASGTTSVGVSGTSSQYIGVLGSSTSNTGMQGSSSSGVGVIGVSSTNAAIRGQVNPASTNSIENIITLLRTTSAGAGANGLGAAIQYELETATSGTSQLAGSLAFDWEDATNATRISRFNIFGVNNATTGRKAALAGSGQWTWDGYGSGTFTGTPTATLQTTSAGAIIEGPLLAAGTYTPTLTNGTNVNASTAYQCQYSRVGNVVTVSGKVDIDPTATGDLELGLSLPVASNIANEQNAGGTIICGDAQGLNGAIKGDATNDRASIIIDVASSASFSYFFTFTYLVL